MLRLPKTHIFNFIATALILALLGLSASFVKKNFDQSSSNLAFEIEQEGDDCEDDNELELGLNFDRSTIKISAKIFAEISSDASPQILFSSVPTSPPNC